MENLFQKAVDVFNTDSSVLDCIKKAELFYKKEEYAKAKKEINKALDVYYLEHFKYNRQGTPTQAELEDDSFLDRLDSYAMDENVLLLSSIKIELTNLIIEKLKEFYTKENGYQYRITAREVLDYLKKNTVSMGVITIESAHHLMEEIPPVLRRSFEELIKNLPLTAIALPIYDKDNGIKYTTFGEIQENVPHLSLLDIFCVFCNCRRFGDFYDSMQTHDEVIVNDK